MRVMVDDNPNFQHWSGNAAIATGIAPTKASQFDSKTIDQTIADVISHGTRFKSVAAAASGDPKQSYSSLGGANTLPAEASPLSLYTRLFGPGFQDPVQGRLETRSAGDAAAERAVGRGRRPQALHAESGRRRQAPAWTSISPRCARPSCRWRPNCSARRSWPRSRSRPRRARWRCNNALPNVRKVTPLMARLGALALATDQTRVFNLAISEPGSKIFVPGDPLGYHQSPPHEEPIDPVLGYQPRVAPSTMSTAWSCSPAC